MSEMTRAKRLRKLREELKQLYATSPPDRCERYKRLMWNAQRELRLTQPERTALLDYCDELSGIGPRS